MMNNVLTAIREFLVGLITGVILFKLIALIVVVGSSKLIQIVEQCFPGPWEAWFHYLVTWGIPIAVLAVTARAVQKFV